MGVYFLVGSSLDMYDVNDNFYLTAPAPLGPWTKRGLIAPAGTNTFDSQTFKGFQAAHTYVYVGARWCGDQEGKRECQPPFPNASSIWLPLQFGANHTIVPMEWRDKWELDVRG